VVSGANGSSAGAGPESAKNIGGKRNIVRKVCIVTIRPIPRARSCDRDRAVGIAVIVPTRILPDSFDHSFTTMQATIAARQDCH
jgi:hypothetical protein